MEIVKGKRVERVFLIVSDLATLSLVIHPNQHDADHGLMYRERISWHTYKYHTNRKSIQPHWVLKLQKSIVAVAAS